MKKSSKKSFYRFRALLLALVFIVLTPAEIFAETQGDQTAQEKVSAETEEGNKDQLQVSEGTEGTQKDLSQVSGETEGEQKDPSQAIEGSEGSEKDPARTNAAAEGDRTDGGTGEDPGDQPKASDVTGDNQSDPIESEANTAADTAEKKQPEDMPGSFDETDEAALTKQEEEPEETGEETGPGGFIPCDFDAPEYEPGLSGLYSIQQDSFSGPFGAALPETYNSETQGYVTSVKDQGSYETCWAFSSLSAAETSMIKNGLVSRDSVDYSEKHLAYFFYNYNGLDDELENTGGDYTEAVLNGSSLYLRGGNQYYAAFALSDWMGAAGEDQFPYTFTKDPDKTSENYFTSTAHLQNFYFLDYSAGNATSISQVKNAIRDYGSVVIGYYSDSTGNFTKGSTVYCGNSGYNANHAVTLVGWDDNYGSNGEFNSFTNKPSGNGAWIMKNSWGTGKGNNGYYYISYYDATIRNVAAFAYEKADNYDHQYFYDGSCGLNYISSGSAGGKYANVFTAKKDSELLKAVSAAFSSAGVSYTVQVYKNPVNGNPSSGTLACTVSGSTTYAGFYTIPLTSPVVLQKDDVFSVVVTLSRANDQIFIDKTSDGGWIRFHTEEKQGQSYFYNGSGWSDLYSAGQTLRIRAYTIESDNLTVTLKSGGNTFTYNRSAQTPEIEVYYGKTKLESGAADGYTVSYTNNTNAGTALITVSGTGKYAGYTATENFTIQPLSLASGQMSVSLAGGASYEYTGNSREPAILAVHNPELFGQDSYQLVKGRDYTVVYTNNVSPGEAVATVTGKGNYTNVVTLPFTINEPTPDEVLTPYVSPDYSGEIESGTKVLIHCKTDGAEIHYSLSGGQDSVTDSIYSGSPVSIRGNGGNTVTLSVWAKKENLTSGKASYKYKILADTGDIAPQDLAYWNKLPDTEKRKIWAPDIADRTYTGQNITIDDLNVYYYNKLLVKGTDYTVTYGNNRNENTSAGKRKATVTITGKGNNIGTVRKEFTIKPVNLTTLNDGEFDICETLTIPWAKGVQKPSPAVYFNEIALRKGTDYTLVYKQGNQEVNGLTSDETKDITYEIEYTGKGNFSGTCKKTTVVTVKAKGTAVTSIARARLAFTQTGSYFYTGSPWTPKFSVSMGKVGTLYEGKDYTVRWFNNINKGTAKLVLTGIGLYNGTLTRNFVIQARKVAESSVSAFITDSVIVYQKGGVKPAVAVKYNGVLLSEGTDYTVSYSQNNAINKKVKCTIRGKGNFTGSKTIESPVTTKAADLAKQTLLISDMKFVNRSNAYKAVPTILDENGRVLGAGSDYDRNVKYVYETVIQTTHYEGREVGTSVPVVGETIRIIIQGKGNYSGKLEGTYKIVDPNTRIPFTRASIRVEPQTYTGREILPCGDRDITESGDLTIRVGKTTLHYGTDYEIVAYLNNINKGTGYIILKGKGDYYGTRKMPFTIRVRKN